MDVIFDSLEEFTQDLADWREEAQRAGKDLGEFVERCLVRMTAHHAPTAESEGMMAKVYIVAGYILRDTEGRSLVEATEYIGEARQDGNPDGERVIQQAAERYRQVQGELEALGLKVRRGVFTRFGEMSTDSLE